jgi:hypothetical protein
VKSYVNIITSVRTSSLVKDQLGLVASPSSIAGQISASAPLDTVLINVSVKDRDPARAADRQCRGRNLLRRASRVSVPTAGTTRRSADVRPCSSATTSRATETRAGRAHRDSAPTDSPSSGPGQLRGGRGKPTARSGEDSTPASGGPRAVQKPADLLYRDDQS